MTVFAPFACDEEIEFLGKRLLDRTLPKSEWTHRAHFAATLWLLESRTEPALAHVGARAGSRPS